LLLKGGELAFQIGEFAAEGGDFVFETSEAIEVGRTDGRFGCGGFGGKRLGRLGCRFADVAGEEMGVAGFFGAGLAREDGDERGLALHQQIEGGVDGAEVVELVEALAAGAELAGSLRAAEQEDAEEGDFVAMEIEGFLEAMLELGDAGVGGGGTGEAVLVQGVEGVADGVLVEVGDGVAIGFLVAGVEDGVEGERVVVRSGDFFFDEGAEDTGFGGGEVDVHEDR
jgi:hypothetical protein